MSPGLEPRLGRALRSGDGDAAELAARFARRAEREGMVEVAYATADSPVGELLVAATERGLLRLSLPDKDFDRILEDLAARVSPRVLEAPARVEAVRRELDEYFAGRRREFDLALDRRLVSPGFAAGVLDAIGAVPFGEAITYAEAAARAGNPRAYRAAGNALGANPIPVVIPCHRVVRTGGDVGNYGGGPELKRFLLRHEGWLE